MQLKNTAVVKETLWHSTGISAYRKPDVCITIRNNCYFMYSQQCYVKHSENIGAFPKCQHDIGAVNTHKTFSGVRMPAKPYSSPKQVRFTLTETVKGADLLIPVCTFHILRCQMTGSASYFFTVYSLSSKNQLQNILSICSGKSRIFSQKILQ